MDWAAYVDVATKMHDLPLDPARRDEVIEQLKRIEIYARSVIDFDVPSETEPAPVFRA